jgi:hypothetical protein
MTKFMNIRDWVSRFLGHGTDEELCSGSIQCNEWSNQNSYHLFTTVRPFRYDVPSEVIRHKVLARAVVVLESSSSIQREMRSPSHSTN